jgi:cytochrome c2
MMRYYRYLLAIPLLFATASPASAVLKFYEVFKKEYLDTHKDKKFAEAVGKADVKCLVCHQGKNRKAHNAFGEELDKLLDRKKDLKDEKKISESIKKVLAMRVDPKNEKSETYLDRLTHSKWPGGELEELKKEPKKAPNGAAEKEEKKE